MKFTILKIKKDNKKSVNDYKQEMLLKEGREQFKSLIKRGLSVPVALL